MQGSTPKITHKNINKKLTTKLLLHTESKTTKLLCTVEIYSTLQG